MGIKQIVVTATGTVNAFTTVSVSRIIPKDSSQINIPADQVDAVVVNPRQLRRRFLAFFH
jgi:hypothetical protein